MKFEVVDYSNPTGAVCKYSSVRDPYTCERDCMMCKAVIPTETGEILFNRAHKCYEPRY